MPVEEGGGPPSGGSAPAVAGFESNKIAPNLYEYTSTGNGIAQTGAAVTTPLRFPYPHKLLRVEIKHTDGSDVDSITALTYNIKRVFAKGLIFNMRTASLTTSTDSLEEFGECYWLPSCEYQLVTNTTNGHRVYAKFVFEV